MHREVAFPVPNPVADGYQSGINLSNVVFKSHQTIP